MSVDKLPYPTFQLVYLIKLTKMVQLKTHNRHKAFQNSSNAFRAVHRAVRSVLESAPWLEELIPEVTIRPEVADKVVQPQEMSLSFSGNEFEKTQYKQKKNEIEISQEIIFPKPISQTMAVTSNTTKPQWGNLQVIGQVDLTYVVAQSDDAIFYIDQHAAHERVAYETLVAHWSQGHIDIQNYLVPLNIKVSEDAAQFFEKEKSEWEKLGIFLERFGPGAIAVNAAPQLIKEKALEAAFKQMDEEFSSNGGSFSLENKIRDICATMACHSVVRAGQALSVKEMTNLLVDMDQFPLSSFCPHGRPVYIKHKFSSLEKEFGRI